MSITTQTKLNQTTIGSDGTIIARLSKNIMNGDVVLTNEWHRITIEPGADIDQKILETNAHLARLGYPPIAQDDGQKLKKLAATLNGEAT